MAENAIPTRKDSGISDPGESLSPEEKKARTATSFTRKVELLEAWAEDGPPEGQWWPRNPTELRQWHQPEIHRGLRAWSSPNVATTSGPYGDLRQRFDAVLIKLLARRQTSPRAELQQERAARARAEAQVLALAAQNATLLDRLRRLENDYQLVKAARDAAQRRVTDYETSFGRLAPLPMAQPEEV